MSGPERLTASEAVARLAAGTLSAEALTRANEADEATRTHTEAATIAAQLSGPDAIPLLERLRAPTEVHG